MIRIAIALSLLCTGCIVHGHRPATTTRTVVVVKDKSCPPSQHWDGNECRHNGKGHGARKHDGR